MTTFYFRRSVEKAFELDEPPSDLSLNPNSPPKANPPFITTAVDDVMYIFNQVVDRCIATSHKVVISSVLPTLGRVLGSDFIGMIQRKMRDESYPKSTVPDVPPAESTIVAFLVLLNDLDMAADYVKRIVVSRIKANPGVGSVNGVERVAPIALKNLFPLNHDAVLVTSALKSLQNTFDEKSLDLINDGIYVVFKNVMKPRLRPILAQAFRNVDYYLSREDDADANRNGEGVEAEDSSSETVVQHHFQRGWGLLTKPVTRILTDRNYHKLLATMVTYLGEVLEKRIWSYYGRLDDLGAVRLERDIASIVGIVVRGGRYGMRDAFARCSQICLVMNMENDEWEELQAAPPELKDPGWEWKISNEERTRARAMVIGKR